MKRFLVLIPFLASFSAFGQQIPYEALLRLDSLIFRLHGALNVQKEIEVDEIKGVYKLTAWHFVPSLNYDFISNRYYLSVSSSAFVSNMISKRQEKRRLSSIERRYDNLEKTSEIRLKSLHFQLTQKLSNLQLSYEILLNDIEIFKIKHREHAENEIDTETYLKEKSSILNKIKTHNSDVSDIQRFLYDIEQLTESGIDMDLLPFFVSSSNLF